MFDSWWTFFYWCLFWLWIHLLIIIYERFLQYIFEKYGISDLVGILIHKDRVKKIYKAKFFLWFNKKILPFLHNNPKIYTTLKELYKFLDYYGVKYKFKIYTLWWRIPKIVRKKIIKNIKILIFLCFCYLLITKIFYLSIFNLVIYILEHILRLIWIYEFDDGTLNYQDFIKYYFKQIYKWRKFFKCKKNEFDEIYGKEKEKKYKKEFDEAYKNANEETLKKDKKAFEDLYEQHKKDKTSEGKDSIEKFLEQYLKMFEELEKKFKKEKKE